jgi:hypothetical protein
MALFSSAILTGTDASKSSVSPAPSSLTVGRLFFATDTGIVYRDNGTTFVNMDVAGGGGSGVASLNALTGALSITAGANVTVTASGTSIEIAASGGGGGGGTPFSTPPTTLAAPNGGTTYTLGTASANPTSSFYFVNGSKKIYGLSYTISGTTLTLIGTLAAAPPNTGDTHELYYS